MKLRIIEGKVAKEENKNSIISAFETLRDLPARANAFRRDSWAELQKVHKPSRQETIQTTIRVLMLVFVFAFFLGLTDWVTGWVMQQLITS